MTVVDALAVLEGAVLECKQRDIYTPEMREALNFLEQQRIWPDWLIPRFRYYARLKENGIDKEAKQQALRAIFPHICQAVRNRRKQRCGYTY